VTFVEQIYDFVQDEGVMQPRKRVQDISNLHVRRPTAKCVCKAKARLYRNQGVILTNFFIRLFTLPNLLNTFRFVVE
jgi:hypothetical protein